MANRPLSTEDLNHTVEYAREAFTAMGGARVFITGGTGFFGHWLLESLLHANRALDLKIQVTVLTRNPSQFHLDSPHVAQDAAVTLHQGNIRNFDFPSGTFSHIVHAATDSSSRHAERPAYEVAESILDGTRRILQLAGKAQTSRLLYVSSGSVYGRASTLPAIPENYREAPDPLSLQSSYDEAKRMAEHLCVAYANGKSLQPVIARCFAFVGPHLPLDRHFAIGNFLNAAMRDEPIHIRGDGTPRRSWLYMADLAAWLWRILSSGQANRAYNVGSDEAYSIAEAARLTAATLRPDGPGCSMLAVSIDGKPTAGAPLNSYIPDINRAREELGLQVRVPLAEALRRTATWHGYRVP